MKIGAQLKSKKIVKKENKAKVAVVNQKPEHKPIAVPIKSKKYGGFESYPEDMLMNANMPHDIDNSTAFTQTQAYRSA